MLVSANEDPLVAASRQWNRAARVYEQIVCDDVVNKISKRMGLRDISDTMELQRCLVYHDMGFSAVFVDAGVPCVEGWPTSG